MGAAPIGLPASVGRTRDVAPRGAWKGTERGRNAPAPQVLALTSQATMKEERPLLIRPIRGSRSRCGLDKIEIRFAKAGDRDAFTASWRRMSPSWR